MWQVWRWLVETRGADSRSSEFATHLAETHAAGIHLTQSFRRVPAKTKTKSLLRPDDLQSVPGIGPAIEKQLRSLEITTVSKLRTALEQAETIGVARVEWLRENLSAHPVSYSD